MINIDIQSYIDLNYVTDTRKSRRKGTNSTQELLSLNGGKKFDIVLMNPPYASTGNGVIHLQFVDKCLEISDTQVVIMPFTFVTKIYNKANNKFKEKFSKYLVSIDEIDSSVFEKTTMPNVGIYKFDKNKVEDTIKINKIDGTNKTVKSLMDISRFSEYEKPIFDYCKNDKPNCDGFGPTGDDKNKYLAEVTDKWIAKKWPNDDKVFLIVNRATPTREGKFISGKVGQILKSTKELKDLMMQRNGSICNIMTFNTVKEAENCKYALINSYVLRFLLYRMQDDQNMVARIFQVVPDVDWEDERVKTDEGLLELCGCPKKKCKEYADYCKKIIEKVDNK